ncbi:MAG: hypothetical protein AB7W16_03245 [Candidatus Obscuribacterales bacterium]
MPEDTLDLLEMWDDLCAMVGDELMPAGLEGAVLKPLGAMTAAPGLIHHSFSSDNFNDRKVAATLAGYLDNAEPGLLEDLFARESARDQALAADDSKRLECQSVVEDIVFAAARWCRRPELRSAGESLLKKVVSETVEGRYWNTASYAMTVLRCHQSPGSQEMLVKFEQFCLPANGTPPALPAHPSAPTLEQEAQFARGLAEGDPRTLSSIDQLLDEKDEACKNFSWSKENSDWLEQFFQAARKA